MKAPESIAQQRQKEARVLKLFLACSLGGSLAFHGLAMTTRMGHFWNPIAEADESETEIIVEAAPELAPSEPPPEQAVVEAVPELEPQEVALAPAPPLAPTSQAPLAAGEDAPSNKPTAPTRDPVSAMTSPTGDASAVGKEGGGPITRPDGKGDGFGFSNIPTGFNLFGKPDGDVKGTPGGIPGGTPDGIGTQTSTRTAPATPLPAPSKLTCLSCPKPTYRGSEGSPRVIYDIAPDGRVINVRLRKSSGNAETDRETLETMSKWRFDPKSVPPGGQSNVRKKITFEEEGSQFQRQNEQRRRANDRQRAEEERQRREVEQTKPAPTAVKEPPVKPTDAPTSERSRPTPEPSAPPPNPVMPVPAPATEPLPPPASAAPPAPSPEPAAPLEAPPAESATP